MAGPLAEATADIRLSDGRFNTDLATILAKLRAAITQMEAQSKIDLTATIKINDTEAKATLAAFHEEAATATLTTTVNVDDSAARATLATFRQEASVADQISVQIDAHTAGLEAARDELVNLALLADSLTDKRVTIDAALRDEEAISTALHLQELLTELGSETVIVTADVNATEALASIAGLSLELDKLDARHVDVKVSAEGVAAAGAEVTAADAAAGNAASDSGGFGRLALRLGFFGVAGVAAIGALGAKITQLGVSSAAALEGTIASFTNILGSATAAQTLFTQLQAFSIPSPFDTQTLATTARQLLAIGDTAQQVVPDVKTLSAVVAELGNSDPEAFGRLTLALGQIGSSVKPLTQDVRQITSAIPGFNAQVQLAQGVASQFGISVDEATKKIQDGGVSGAAAMRILLEQMQNFPGASGAIAAAADTLQGRLSSFKDTVKLDLVGAFSGVTVQVKNALEPLSESVDVALKAIGPQLATALSGLIPAIGPFIERLGPALGQAFGGIATGLGGVIQGIGPALSAVLPAVGHLAETFGDLAAAIGPSLATSITVLSDTVIPVLDSLSQALEAIPTGVLSTLLTGFLAFKGIGAIRGIFDDLALSMQKASVAAEGSAASLKKLEEGGVATGNFGKAAALASSTVVGAFSGIALASEDMSTRVLGAVGAVSSVVAQLATGNIVGAAFTAGATVVGTLIGQFEAGKTAAKNFQTAVENLATSIKTNLKLDPGEVPDLGAIVTSQAFNTEFENTLGTKFRGALVHAFSIKDSDVKTALQGTQDQFDAFIAQFEATADSKGNISLPKLLLGSPSDQDALVAALTKLRNLAVGSQTAIQDSQDASAGSVDALTQSLALSAVQMVDTGTAAAALGDGLGKTINSVDANTKAILDQVLPAKSLSEQYQTMASALFGLSPAFAQFAQSLDITPDLERVKKSADDLKTTFSDLTSALSQSISNQNLQAQLDGLSTSLDAVIGQDKFEAAKQRADSISSQIEDQQSRIADLKASLAEAEAKALQDAADLDVRIADAKKFGSVTGLAALEAAKANVGDQADKAQRDLDRAERQLGDLKDQLAGIDVTTPAKLIDTVKAQAKAAGVDLWTFLLQGPTAEARQVYQQDLAAVVNSAFTNIQQADDKQGPQAALDLLGSIQTKLHDQLIAGGLSPGTADEIVQNMLHPSELTKSLTDELNANLAAATDAATAAGHTVDVGLTTGDITKALEDLQTKLDIAPPVSVPFTFNFSTKNPFDVPVKPTIDPTTFAPDVQSALDLVNGGISVPVVPDVSGIQGALNLVNGQLPATVVPDFADADRQSAIHDAPLSSVVAPDFADADRQVATHTGSFSAFVNAAFDGTQEQLDAFNATLPVDVVPNTSLLDQALALQRTVVVQLTADPNQIVQFNARPGLSVPQAEGGILQFFRSGGFSGRDAAHVAQIAPAGSWRVWAEPETGGEGYVPLALSKRDRSTEIVRTIADMFGYRLEPKIDVNPTIDIFPAVSPVVNLHPSFTVPPSSVPDRAGRDSTLVQTFTHALASFDQPTMPITYASMPVTYGVEARKSWSEQVPSGHVGMYLPLPHGSDVGRFVPSLTGLVGAGWQVAGPDRIITEQSFSDSLRGFDRPVPYNVASERERSAVPPVAVSNLMQQSFGLGREVQVTGPSTLTSSSVVSNLASTIVNSVVQSLMADSPSPSRPAVTSVVHMTGWTTAHPSPSWVEALTGDPKIPDLAAFANRPSVTIIDHAGKPFGASGQPITVMFGTPPSSSALGPSLGFGYQASGIGNLSAVSPWSVPSMFEHDNPASPSPVGSQLVVWGSVPREALPPGATGGPAQLFANLTAGSMSAWFDPKTPNVTTIASLFAQSAAPSQVTSLFGAQPTHVTPLLNPDLAVQVTSTPDRELAQAVRELTMMLRSGSPHSERLARAESIARHIHVHEGAITLTSDKPRQSARELVDELTRMAY